jgi:lipoprotein-releasing system ATP-binding protein
MSLLVTNLHKEYPTRGGSLSILSDINLCLEPGQPLAIMGPSGSGKSTLLHILGTLDRPTRGTALLNNENPFAMTESALAAFRNERIGFVFQDHHLLPQCTVLENVLIPTLVSPRRHQQREEVARSLLQRVGLAERQEHRPAELSGGERQRVAVARALINNPQLLLADEPTGNLDRRAAQTVGTLLLELSHQEDVILIVVTHSQDLAHRFPRRMELLDGTLQPL